MSRRRVPDQPEHEPSDLPGARPDEPELAAPPNAAESLGSADLREGPLDVVPALDLARLGFELATLLLAVPRAAKSAAAVSRIVVDLVTAGGGRWSDEGLERMLVLQSVTEWLDHERDVGWEISEFELHRGHGEYLVAAEDDRTGEAFVWVVSLRTYRTTLAPERLNEAWRLRALRASPVRVGPLDLSPDDVSRGRTKTGQD